MTITTTARARITDPTTSHSAAASVEGITETQAVILRLLEVPGTDTDLVNRYHQAWFTERDTVPRASDSGIRSRRAELVALGLVKDSGERALTPSGRQAIVWVTA